LLKFILNWLAYEYFWYFFKILTLVYRFKIHLNSTTAHKWKLSMVEKCFAIYWQDSCHGVKIPFIGKPFFYRVTITNLIEFLLYVNS
jgi:hypothetical protein